jgi:methyl-accepting chemotaxis protein
MAAEGSETVASLKNTFDRIVDMVIEMDGRVDQIAQAANREAQTANTVSGTIKHVATSARETATGAEQVMAATEELHGTARTLESMVEQFQLTELPEDYAA